MGIPRVKYQVQKALNGNNYKLVQQVGSGSIIKRFDKTPYPTAENDVVCPHFLELKWANGCPYNCSWCYLQGTFRFSENGKKPRIKDYKQIKDDVSAFLPTKRPELLNTGELADSLMYEHVKNPFSKFIIPMFEGTNHQVLFLTKSDNIENLLKIENHSSAIIAFTVNASKVAAQWEKGAPAPQKRLEAAYLLKLSGYDIRLRIDPIVPVDNWKEEYKKLMTVVARVNPNRITLGTLRGLRSTIAHAPDKTWLKYLEDGDNTGWGRKMAFQQRLKIYGYMIDCLKEIGITEVGICKETIGMWNSLGIDYKKIKCNCVL